MGQRIVENQCDVSVSTGQRRLLAGLLKYGWILQLAECTYEREDFYPDCFNFGSEMGYLNECENLCLIPWLCVVPGCPCLPREAACLLLDL